MNNSACSSRAFRVFPMSRSIYIDRDFSTGVHQYATGMYAALHNSHMVRMRSTGIGCAKHPVAAIARLIIRKSTAVWMWCIYCP